MLLNLLGGYGRQLFMEIEILRLLESIEDSGVLLAPVL